MHDEGLERPDHSTYSQNCLFCPVSSWLRQHEPEATEKLGASLPRRDELSRLKKELCCRLHLADIRSPLPAVTCSFAWFTEVLVLH